MATSRKHAKPTTKRHPAPVSSLLFHRLNALLHSVRSIAQHEDELCTLLHAAKNALDPDLAQDLRQLLDAMPSHDYTSDLDALRDCLPPVAAPAPKKQVGSKAPRLPVKTPAKAPAKGRLRAPAKLKTGAPARHKSASKKPARSRPS